jgi:tetratricopeptide (TPR) repeat protein
MSTAVFSLPDRRLVWVMYAGLLLVLSALCFAGLKDHLLDTHDAETFQDNLAISRDFSFFFSSQKATASGRLVDELVLWLAHAVWGNDPGLFHLLCVAAHTLASFSLARLFARLGVDLELSLLAGLLFLVNVAHVQAVQWISALEYPLALLCSAAAVGAYARFVASGRRWWLVAFYLALCLSLLAHIATSMVWLFCLFWSWRQGLGIRTALRHLAGFGLVALPTLVLIARTTSRHTSTWDALGSYASADLLSQFLGMMRILLWFSGRLFTTAHWLPLPVYEQHLWELATGALVVGMLAWLIWRRIFPADLGAAWAVLMLLPFLLLTEEIILDLPAGPSRYLYLSTAGSSLLLAWGLQRMGWWLQAGWKRTGGALYVAAIVGLVAFSGATLKKAEAFSFYTSGRSYLASNDMDTGILQLRRAIDRGRDIIDLKDAYARLCLMLLKDPDQARPVLEEALQKYPEHIPLNIYRLALDSVGPDPDGAQQATAQLEAFKDQLDVVELIGQSYYNLGMGADLRGDPESAIAAYGRSLEFLPDRARTLKSLAQALVKAGRRQEAIPLFLQAVHLALGDADLLYSAALALKMEGEVHQAMALCRQALDLKADAEAFYLLGMCHEELGQQQEALATYRQSIALGTATAAPYARLAGLLVASGQAGEAVQVLEEAARAGAANAQLYTRLGNLYYRQGEAARAAVAYDRAVQLDPDNAQTYSNLGTALRAAGRLQEAANAYQRAIELRPEDPLLHHNLGGLELEQGNLEGAKNALQQAAHLGSRNAETYLGLSHILHQEGRLEEALRLYDLVLASDLEGADSQLYTRMGEELYSLGQIGAASRAYRKALKQDPDNGTARTNLGWCLYEQGELDQAIAQYRQALAHQPNSAAQFNLGLALLAKGEVAQAQTVYAQGLARYGAEEAERIGAVGALRKLIQSGAHAAEAQRLLDMYWKDWQR